jgi:hypothetical protein
LLKAVTMPDPAIGFEVLGPAFDTAEMALASSASRRLAKVLHGYTANVGIIKL